MKILVACEESQAVTIELRKLGHEAYSCDIEPCSGGHPEWHLQNDVLGLLDGNVMFQTVDGIIHIIVGKWDMIIAFPPCTYLSNAGARHLWAGGVLNEERYQKGLEAKQFFMQIYNTDCPRIAIENPISSRIYNMPPHSQEIHPYQFGHPYTKATRLWLKGLPPLMATEITIPKMPYVNSSKATIKGQYGSKKTPKDKSKTFPGIAKAMAAQWCGELKGDEANAKNHFQSR